MGYESYMDTRFDSCSLAELDYCRVSRVESLCEIEKIRRLRVLEDYPKTRAGLVFGVLSQKSDLKEIDRIINLLKTSGCHNYRIYKEQHIIVQGSKQ